MCDLVLAAKLSPRDKTIHQTLGICYHKLVTNVFIPASLLLSLLLLLLLTKINWKGMIFSPCSQGPAGCRVAEQHWNAVPAPKLADTDYYYYLLLFIYLLFVYLLVILPLLLLLLLLLSKVYVTGRFVEQWETCPSVFSQQVSNSLLQSLILWEDIYQSSDWYVATKQIDCEAL